MFDQSKGEMSCHRSTRLFGGDETIVSDSEAVVETWKVMGLNPTPQLICKEAVIVFTNCEGDYMRFIDGLTNQNILDLAKSINAGGKKIAAIKLLRCAFNLGLFDAKELVESL